MTSKEFVKKDFPDARAEKQTTKGGRTYWLIRKKRGETMYIASGTTQSNAWTNAKKHIQSVKKEKVEKIKNIQQLIEEE